MLIMLAIQLTINLFVLVAIVASATLLGFLFRSLQISKLKRKVIDLENEMLRNHSEILDLHRENASLEQQMKQINIPVINIKSARDEKSGDNLDSGSKKSGGTKKA
jgi:hypothetical protein